MIRLKVKRGWKLKQIDLSNSIQTPTNKKDFKKTKKNFSKIARRTFSKVKKKPNMSTFRKEGKAM